VTPVGGSGTVTAGTNVFEAAEGALGPRPEVARTVHEYVRPVQSPPTRIGPAAPDAEPLGPPFDETQVAV